MITIVNSIGNSRENIIKNYVNKNNNDNLKSVKSKVTTMTFTIDLRRYRGLKKRQFEQYYFPPKTKLN
jgi:hypothetical protein